jgi:uncharacterized protein YcbX
MYVSEIWRYPVKSMRGQRLSHSEVLRSGLAGDRRIVVVSRASGKLITARTHPGLLGLKAEVQEDGSTTIDGLPWNSHAAGELVNEAANDRVELVDLSTSTHRFDVLPLLVATDGAINALGIDSRRLRPNIIVAGVPGTTEREWPGHSLRLGPVVIDVAKLRMRCVMTTYDPDTLEQEFSVLFRIVSEMGGKLALDCAVRLPGHLRENDPVELRD